MGLSEFVNILAFITKSNLNLKDDLTDNAKMTLPLLYQQHAILKDEDLSRQEKKKKCKEILEKLENNKAVERLLNKLSLHLKSGDLLNMK